MQKVSQVDWCLTSSTAGSFWPRGRFSKPVTRLRMPRIQWPPFTATSSQPTHIQYRRAPLMKGAAISTAVAHGITVSTIHSMCRIERIRFIVN